MDRLCPSTPGGPPRRRQTHPQQRWFSRDGDCALLQVLRGSQPRRPRIDWIRLPPNLGGDLRIPAHSHDLRLPQSPPEATVCNGPPTVDETLALGTPPIVLIAAGSACPWLASPDPITADRPAPSTPVEASGRLRRPHRQCCVCRDGECAVRQSGPLRPSRRQTDSLPAGSDLNLHETLSFQGNSMTSADTGATACNDLHRSDACG